MQCEKRCPVEVVMKYIGRKWSIEIIKQLFFGSTYFKDFLAGNQGLSGKVLAQRLKELETNRIIEKRAIGKYPVRIEYSLTKKGRALNKIVYEMINFGIDNYRDEVADEFEGEESREQMKKIFNIR